MAARETGKQRASRIPLDYYKGWTRLERWFYAGGLAGVVLAVAWPVAAYVTRDDHGDMLYSRGPVTAKHATWDANCTACHEPFSPMHERVGFAGDSVTNQKCISCHAGPVHHVRQIR